MILEIRLSFLKVRKHKNSENKTTKIKNKNIKVLELQYSTGSNTYSVMVVYEEENSIKPSQYRVVT